MIVELGVVIWFLVSLRKEVSSLRHDHHETLRNVWSGMIAQIVEIQNATPAIGNSLGAILQQFISLRTELDQSDAVRAAERDQQFLALRGELELNRSENGQRAGQLDKRFEAVVNQLQTSFGEILRAFQHDVTAGMASASERSADERAKSRDALLVQLDAVRSEVEKLRQEIKETVSFT